MTDDEITQIALAVGFIVHNGWGNLSDIKPVADAETLRCFARAIIDAEKEGRGVPPLRYSDKVEKSSDGTEIRRLEIDITGEA